ncbi:MAG: porin [Rhodospirillaceae bacterium]|nr:porin [Rhodospirillaceae bacterium]
MASTTVLAFAGASLISAADAQAQNKAMKMSAGVTGSFKSILAFGDQDSKFESTTSGTSRTGYDQFNIWNNSEIHFTGTTKLDSGVTVSVLVELESDAVKGGSTIDASHLTVAGGFGSFRIGTTNNVTKVLGNIAPYVGITSSNDGDASNVIITPSAVSVGADTYLVTSKHMAIAYISPSFSGFGVAASYIPSTTNTTDVMPAVGGNTGTELQQYNVAVTYGGKLGSADLKADVSYAENHGEAASSSKGWRGGLNVGIGGFVVGGSYRVVSEIDKGLTTTANNPNEKAFDLGFTYGVGDWAVGINYLNVVAPKSTSTAGDDEASQLFFGASYRIGTGVDFLGNVFYADWDDELTTHGNNNSGFGALAGISVSF